MKSNKINLYTLIAPILVFGLAASLPGCRNPRPDQVELEFWGVFDDSDLYKSLIDEFEAQFPNITVNYYKKTYQDYEKDLLEAMATGRGPDIFMMHNTWLARYNDRIWAAPFDFITLKQFQNDFVDVVVDDFVIDGFIGAIPLSVDTLALYYNKDILNTSGIAQPPRTWEEFLTDVEILTIKDERGNIVRAGASLGTARNVNRSTDILSLLMLQSGAQMVNSQKTRATFDRSVNLGGEKFYPGERALEFYIDFANPLKSIHTWNTRMHYSIDAFYEGQTAMMFNYSYHIPTIRAKSPYLNFAVSEMPQIDFMDNDINYANYWGLTVSHNSQDFEPAWKFIVWLTQKEQAQKYLELAKKPTARRDLVDFQKDDPDLGVFAEQSLTARSWYQVDNSVIEIILADMIESIVVGEAIIEDAILKAVNQVNLLMK